MSTEARLIAESDQANRPAIVETEFDEEIVFYESEAEFTESIPSISNRSESIRQNLTSSEEEDSLDWSTDTSSEGSSEWDSSLSGSESFDTDSFDELSSMSSEKYIPKFDDKRENFEAFMTKWIAHGMRAKFSTVNKPEIHPEMPEDGVYTIDMTKRQKKLLKMNERALADLRTAFSEAWRCEAIIEKSCTTKASDDQHDLQKRNKWPSGRIWLVLADLNKMYRGSSRLDRLDLDKQKATVVLNPGEHPDDQFYRLYKLRKAFRHRSCQPSDDELIAQLINGSRDPYTVPYTQKLIELEQEKDGTVVLEKLQELGNELYMAHNAANSSDKGPVISMMFAQNNKDPRDKWNKQMLCFWCGGENHKAYNCPKRANGEPKSYFGPGSTATVSNNNNNSGGITGGNNANKRCPICKKKHKNPDAGCFERSENADKRPEGWTSSLTAARRKELNLANLTNGRGRQGNPGEMYLMSSDQDRVRTYEEQKLHRVEEDVLSGRIEKFPDQWDLLYNDNVFVFDTGATQTCSYSGRGATNVRESTAITMTQGGEEIGQQCIGDIPIEKIDKNGEKLYSTVMKDVHFSKHNRFNLFAVNPKLDEGWEARGNSADGWSLIKGKQQIRFDIKISTPTSCVWAGYFRRRVQPEAKFAAFSPEGTKMTIQKAHVLLGHPDEEKTRAGAKARGWILSKGNLKKCEHCAKGKAKRKNIPSDGDHEKADKAGQRLYLDISSLKNPKNKDPNDKTPFVAKPHMRLIHDEFSTCRFIRWFSKKNDMVEATCELLHNWAVKGNKCEFIRMDNAGENKMLEQRMRSEAWKFSIDVEYTGRDSPWQNSPAETGIFTICNKARAMCSYANVPEKYRYRVFPLACETSCNLDWLVVVNKEGVKKTRIEWFNGKIPRFAKYLRTFGEAGVVKTKTDTTAKVFDRGVTCMMGGYCPNHEGDCYQMYDPINNVVYYTRDVVWLQRMYFPDEPGVGRLERDWFDNFNEEFHYAKSGRKKKKKKNGSQQPDNSNIANGEEKRDKVVRFEADMKNTGDDNSHNEGINGSEEEPEEEQEEEEQEVERDYNKEPRRSGRRIASTQNPDFVYASMKKGSKEIANLAMQQIQIERLFLKRMQNLSELHLLSVNTPTTEAANYEVGLVGATGTAFENTADLRTMNYKEAMESEHKDKFIEGIDTEHAKLTKYGVVVEEDIDNLRPEDEVIDSTWAHKMKPNGVVRSRVAARGFKQTDGLNYDSTDTSAPVICDISIRVCLILMAMAGWLAWIVDVEGAFLNGRFQNGERLFMKVPDGFQKYYPSYVVLRLMRTLYGLKQAAMQFWREARKAMTATQMTVNKADPCLFYKWEQGELLIMLLWVDDFCIMGPDALVKEHRDRLKSLFDCKDVGEMNEYVGCQVEHDRLNRTVRLTQPVKIKRFEDEYDTSWIRGTPRTPAEGGSTLKKEGEGPEDTILDHEQQKEYRSATAVLLHMMRWSRVEIQNAVRDCSRYMTEGRKSHMKALQRIMKYCIGTPRRGLTLAPKEKWNGMKGFMFQLKGMSDSEYAADETRYSVNGWSTWLNGAPVTCRSKMMPIIALSVMEAELYAAVQCAMDMMYIWRIMTGLQLTIATPMILEVDNKGCVDFCNNWSVAGRTRHIEVKQYFLRDLKELGIIKVVWKSGDDMTSDIFTKNLNGPLFERHGSKLYGEDEYFIAAMSREILINI